MTNEDRGDLTDRVLASKTATVLIALGGVVGVLYLGRKAIIDPFNGVDFKYLWVAGQVWAQGHNPYGPAFSEFFTKTFGAGSAPWSYPPNWWPIAVPLAKVNPIDAERVWRLVNFVCVFGIAALGLPIARCLCPHSKPIASALVVLLYLLFLQAVSISISTGQTSLLATLGAMSFYLGIISKRTLATVFGVVLLTLKPQVAIIAIFGVFALGLARREILIGLVVSAAVAIPALIIGGIHESVLGFLTNIQTYGHLRHNSPLFMTGLEHFAGRITDKLPSSLVWIVIGAASATAFGMAFGRGGVVKTAEDDHRAQAAIMAFPVMTCFIIPLHSYDTALLAPVLLAALCAPYPGRILVFAGLALSFRPMNLVQAFGFTDYDSATTSGNLLISIAYGVLLAGTAAYMLHLARVRALKASS